MLRESLVVFEIKVVHLRHFIGKRKQSYAHGEYLYVAVHAQVVMGVAIAGELVKVQYVFGRRLRILLQTFIETVFSFLNHLFVV